MSAVSFEGGCLGSSTAGSELKEDEVDSPQGIKGDLEPWTDNKAHKKHEIFFKERAQRTQTLDASCLCGTHSGHP